MQLQNRSGNLNRAEIVDHFGKKDNGDPKNVRLPTSLLSVCGVVGTALNFDYFNTLLSRVSIFIC